MRKTEVTLSPKYQVVIPKEVRRELRLKSGQKFIVLVKEGLISLIPERPITEMRGYLKGMNTSHVREEKDRL